MGTGSRAETCSGQRMVSDSGGIGVAVGVGEGIGVGEGVITGVGVDVGAGVAGAQAANNTRETQIGMQRR